MASYQVFGVVIYGTCKLMAFQTTKCQCIEHLIIHLVGYEAWEYERSTVEGLGRGLHMLETASYRERKE